MWLDLGAMVAMSPWVWEVDPSEPQVLVWEGDRWSSPWWSFLSFGSHVLEVSSAAQASLNSLK